MNLQPRQKFLIFAASAIFTAHLVVAAACKPSFGLTIFGDAIPCALLIVAILAVRENFQVQRGVLPIFWKLLAAGMFQMLLSQVYWFYYDTVHRYSTPSPVIGDTFISSRPCLLSLRLCCASLFFHRRARHATPPPGLCAADALVAHAVRLFCAFPGRPSFRTSRGTIRLSICWRSSST